MSTKLTHEIKVIKDGHTTTYHLSSGRKIGRHKWVRIPLSDVSHPYIEKLIQEGVLGVREYQAPSFASTKVADSVEAPVEPQAEAKPEPKPEPVLKPKALAKPKPEPKLEPKAPVEAPVEAPVTPTDVVDQPPVE